MTVNLSDKEIYLLFNKLDRFNALKNKFTVMKQSSFQLRVRKRFIELAACVIDTFFLLSLMLCTIALWCLSLESSLTLREVNIIDYNSLKYSTLLGSSLTIKYDI
jgi:hypothetical protein